MYMRVRILKNKLMEQRGFSLIEVLVSLSIFTVVVTISVGSLMVLITANSRAQNMQSLMTNISYSLDSMTRELRTGADYYCATFASLPVTGATVSDCTSGSSAVSFNEGGQSLTSGASSRRIAFRLQNGTIERRLGNGDGDSNVNEAADWMSVTSPDIEITDLRFHVTGTSRADVSTPTVTLYLKGFAGENDGSRAEFNIETTVVQHLLDV